MKQLINLINSIPEFNPFEKCLPETIYFLLTLKSINWALTLPVKYNEYYNQFLDIQEKISEKLAGS